MGIEEEFDIEIPGRDAEAHLGGRGAELRWARSGVRRVTPLSEGRNAFPVLELPTETVVIRSVKV